LNLMVQPLVEMKHIHKWFGAVHALDDVSVEIYPKEILGIVGDNGAGKSTLVNILAGVISLDKGEIKYEGKKVKIRSVNDARKLGIEAIYQEQVIVGIFSVAENIFLGRELTKRVGPVRILDEDKMRDEAKRTTTALRLNIPSMDQEVRFCSGGETQGVAIARAMYFESKLVILDEPTTALSPQGVNELFAFIDKIRKRGVSVIIISHDLYHIYRIADRIICMSKGKITENVEKQSIMLDDLTSMVLGVKKEKRK
jgi:simple sugar transport system ATP-binding protein